MTSQEELFRRDYTPPLLAYLARRQEKPLHSAYELGRRAMSAGLGLLTLVQVHHEVVLGVLGTVRDVDEAATVVSDASAFLAEALAPFEMAQRGFMAGKGLGSSRADPPRRR